MKKSGGAKAWQQRFMERFYHAKPGWIDGTSEYWDLITRHTEGASTILELGCGPVNNTSRFLRERFDTIHGLDIDPDAKTNACMDEVFVYDGGDWPVESESYDAILCDYVMEHLEKPIETLREVMRALKPGGVFLFRAPNFWHYISLVSAATPHWFHVLVANRLRNLPSDSHDPYPTFYRINTRRDVRRLCKQAGLEERELKMIEKEPAYGMSSRLLFLNFMLYERVVNATDLLADLRINMLGAFRKPHNT